jgi:outer membrane protein assembly factor BamB
MKRSLPGIIALVAAAATGCTDVARRPASDGATFRANAHRSGEYRSPPIERLSEVVWRFPAKMTSLSPAVVDGVLYFGADSVLIALDAATGQEKWRLAARGRIASTPAVAGGVVYFGADSTFYAVDARTAQERWRVTTRGLISSSPAVVENVVYFCSGKDFYAINAPTHREKWRFAYTAAPVPEGTADAAEDKMRLLACPGALAVVDGMVYAAMFDGGIVALNARTGQQTWSVLLSMGTTTSSPAVAAGVVYVARGDSALHARSARHGGEKWMFRAGDDVGSAVAVAREKVFFGTEHGSIIAVNALTGQEVWRFKTDGQTEKGENLVSSPAVAGGVVYVGGIDGVLYALDAANGRVKWSYRTGGRIETSPVIVDRVLYFGSTDGYVYALR